MKYRPEIDGLRAIAVIAVLFYHAEAQWFSGGFTGVDVFFVLSGYLITSILLREMKEGRFSFSHFYERRVKRILPALTLVVFGCLPIAWFTLLPEDMRDFSQSVTAVTLFVANFHFWSKSGYFDSSVDMKPLVHTWSLAVEEQYYFLFPLFLFAIWKSKSLKPFTAILLVSIVSFVYSVWASYNTPSTAFYLLPSRIWELGAGALVAAAPHGLFDIRNQAARHLLSWFGLFTIFFGFIAFDRSTVFPGFSALAPVLGTCLLVLYTDKSSGLGLILSRPAFVHIGLISYGLYLWHQPLFAFARHGCVGHLNWSTYLILSLVSAVLAHLSWKYVETPIRRGNLISIKRLYQTSAFSAVLLIAFGISGHNSSGFEMRMAGMTKHLPQNYLSTAKSMYSISNGLGGNPCVSETASLCQLTQFSGAKESVLLLGDSHSADFSEEFKNWVEKNQFNAWQMSIGGCAFLPSQIGRASGPCDGAQDALAQLVDQTKLTRIILVGNYEGHTRRLDEDSRDKDLAYLAELLFQLKKQDAEVYFFKTRPSFNSDPVRAAILGKLEDLNINVKADNQMAWSHFYENNNGQAHIFDQTSELLNFGCGDLVCFDGHDKAKLPLYRDSNHLTKYGAGLVFRRFLDQFFNPSTISDKSK